MNLEQVKQDLSASYERINNMKVAIGRVESCKSVLLLRRDEVLADVRLMMSEMAQQLLSLQMAMEATVNGTVEERIKFLDAKKQDVLNANSYLVEVCMEADRLLKGRNEDLLGRACQRVFTKFERAWQQLDLAGKIDSRSMASLVLKSNIQRFASSTYVAKLQQLDQYKRVLDEQEFWVVDPSESYASDSSNTSSPQGQMSVNAGSKSSGKLSQSRTTHSPRKSPERSCSSTAVPVQVLETIPEIPETVVSRSHGSTSISVQALETVHESPEPTVSTHKSEIRHVADQKQSSTNVGESAVHIKVSAKKEHGQENNRRLPAVVRIREAELVIESEQQCPDGIMSMQGKSGKMLPLPARTGFCEDEWLETDNMNMRSNQSLEVSDSNFSQVSGDGQSATAPMQTDLEFWNVDSCMEDVSPSSGQESSMVSNELSSSVLSESGRPCRGSTDMSGFCDDTQASTDREGMAGEFCKEQEDFIWFSDEEDKCGVPLETSNLCSEDASSSNEGHRVESSIPGPTGDSQKMSAEAGKVSSETCLSKNIALTTIHQQSESSDKVHSAGQAKSLAGGDGRMSKLCIQSSSLDKTSLAAPDINIIVGKPLVVPPNTTTACINFNPQQGSRLVEEFDVFSNEQKSSSLGAVETEPPKPQGGEAKGWSSRTTWHTGPNTGDRQKKERSCESSQANSATKTTPRLEHMQSKCSQETADASGDTPCTSLDITKPLKTIRTRKLDISSLLVQTGDGYFECPAKLVEKISGNLYFPIGISTNSVGDVIIGDTRNNLVKVFRNGMLINSFGNKLARPSAIVVNDQDEIFVKDDNCVVHYDSDGKYIKTFGRKYMNMPYGMGMTREGKLVVLDALWQDPRILIFGQDGTMTPYRYDPLLDAPQNSKCRFLAVHGDQVLTSDLGCSVLYMTSMSGALHKVLGVYGHGPGELNEPSGITVDSVGNWIVADSKNNRIQVFAPNGFYMCKLRLSEPIRRPSGIHLSRDGLLYIINYLDAIIKVYKVGVA